MADEQHIRRELARVCRVLTSVRMLDLLGHVSARIPNSEAIITTPRFDARFRPMGITEEDLVVVDASGAVLDGSHRLPLQFAADLAIYVKHPRVGACIVGSPVTAMAHGIARRSIEPLLHSTVRLAGRIGVVELDGLALDGSTAMSLADQFGEAIACHQPGVSLIVTGSDLLDATMNLYETEYLAQANLVASQLERPRSLTAQEIDSLGSEIWANAPMIRHHYRELFASLDFGPQVDGWKVFASARTVGPTPDGSSSPDDELKAKLAFSARILWQRGTLVTFLEHISHRVPGTDRWWMTAAKAYNQMEPDDIVTLDYRANWISGPKPPPFKDFHRDIFVARPDVSAIVHTHDLYGRMYAAAELNPEPVHRSGFAVPPSSVALYGTPSPVFREEARRGVVEMLGSGSVVHERSHGTDFVSDSLEGATVLAIQREESLALHSLAHRLGSPIPLGSRLEEELRSQGPTAHDWWTFHGDFVGHRARSAGGLEWSI